MKRDFVVLTRARSGSTWVMDTLNRLEGIKAYGALFLPKQADGRGILSIDYPRYIERPIAKRRAPRPFSIFAYLDELFEQEQSVGFKLMYPQVKNFPEIMLYVLARRIRVIHLVRNNQLDIVISQARSETSGTSHLKDGDFESGPTKFAIDVADLEFKLARIRALQSRARRVLTLLPVSTVEVSYEDISTRAIAWQPILSLLDLNPKTEIPQSVLRKRGKLSQADSISNLSEVERALTGTRFRHLLDK